jgi:hypothetical protein
VVSDFFIDSATQLHIVVSSNGALLLLEADKHSHRTRDCVSRLRIWGFSPALASIGLQTIGYVVYGCVFWGWF